MVKPGAMLGGRYRLVRELGRGGFGEVYLVEDARLGTELAAKVLSGPSMRDPHVREQFVAEARTAARVAGRHVVKVQDVGEDPEFGPFFVMEYLQGRSLLDHLRAQPNGHLPHDAVSSLFAQLKRALSKAHAQGVVHRDLKPENVFLAREEQGDEEVVKLLDFGLAKVLHEHESADLSRAMGTPTFAAPEQLRSVGKVNTYTDVWALGLLAYLTLTGKHYWQSANVARPRAGDVISEVLVDPLDAASVRASSQGVADRLPLGFDVWFGRCVDRDGTRRFGRADDCVDALQKVLAGQPEAPRSSAPGPASMRTGDGFLSMDFSATSEPPPPTVEPRRPTAPGPPPPPPTVATSVEPPPSAPTVKAPGGRGWVAAPLVLLVGGAVGYAALRGPSPVVTPTPMALGSIAAPSPVPPPNPPPPATTPAASVPAPPAPVVASPDPRNPWVAVAPPEGPVVLGVERDRTAEAIRGFRPRRRIEAPGAGFEIQRHEVSWGELDPWLGAHPDQRFPLPEWVAEEASERAGMPVAGVPWAVARAYCRGLGGDLPSEEQWEYAARGASRRPYPWGDTAIDLTRTWVYRGPSGPGPVGAAAQDVTSDTGLRDLLGNVREWTRDLWREDLPAQDESWVQNAQGEVYRAVRGLPLALGRPSVLPAEGAAWRDAMCAEGPCATRDDVRREMASIGFRCVR